MATSVTLRVIPGAISAERLRLFETLPPGDAEVVLIAGLRALEVAREVALNHRTPETRSTADLDELMLELGVVDAAQAPARLPVTADSRRSVSTGVIPSPERSVAMAPAAVTSPDSTVEPLRAEVAGLSHRLDLLLGARGGSSLKGAAGEDFVEALLLRRYPAAELVNCAHQAGRGDFLLRRGGGTPPLLVEVKNVARVTGEDVAKFERDLLASGEARGGVFVSCTPSTLPRIGVFGVHFRGNADAKRPAIYITDVFASPALVEFAVAVLDTLTETVGGDPGDASDEAAALALNQAYDNFRRLFAPIRRAREKLALIGLELQELERVAAESVAPLERLWETHPDLRDARDDVALPRLAPVCLASSADGPAVPGSAEYCVEIIRAHIETSRYNPTRAQVLALCGLTGAALDALGGYRRLLTAAKTHYSP